MSDSTLAGSAEIQDLTAYVETGKWLLVVEMAMITTLYLVKGSMLIIYSRLTLVFTSLKL